MNEKAVTPSIVFICNPIAGNGSSLKALCKIKERLTALGHPFTVEYTKYPEHATELAKAAAQKGADIICAMGGDGTVREVALGLMGTDAVMGICPCGTGNDLVRSLGIPTDIDTILNILLSGKVIRLNCAYANNIPFFNVAGFGIDVDVLDKVDYYKKNTKNGRLAYLKGLFAAIKGRQNRKVTYTLDDGEPVHTNAIMVAAGNGKFVGGGMIITPEADFTDDLLDFTVIHDVYSLFDVFRVIPTLLTGNIYSKKQFVTHLRGKKLAVECEPFSRIQVDGERMPGTPVTFRIAEETVNIMVSASPAEK